MTSPFNAHTERNSSVKIKIGLAYLVSILFLLITATALYLFATTPVVPPVVEQYTYTTTTIKEIGGNGGYITGLGFLAFAAGFASVITLLVGVFGTD
jgi:hypothetical protein